MFTCIVLLQLRWHAVYSVVPHSTLNGQSPHWEAH